MQDYQIAYFIKRNANDKITPNNIAEKIIAGVCDGDPLD